MAYNFYGKCKFFVTLLQFQTDYDIIIGTEQKDGPLRSSA